MSPMATPHSYLLFFAGCQWLYKLPVWHLPIGRGPRRSPGARRAASRACAVRLFASPRFQTGRLVSYLACSGGRLCVTSSDCVAGETCNPGYWKPSQTQCGPGSDASVPSDGTDALDDQSDSDSGAVDATIDASADASE